VSLDRPLTAGPREFSTKQPVASKISYLGLQPARLILLDRGVSNLIVIFGPPASGKSAIGDELAKLTGYRFFHNHLTTDPAAALFGWNSVRYSKMVGVMRELLFREASSDPSIRGVIFTFVWGLDIPEDTALLENTARIFTESGGAVYFVELLASLKARISREGTAFRVNLKPAHRDVDLARARQIEIDAKYRMNTNGEFPLTFPHLVIDTETIDPEAAARTIANAFRLPG
jgi:cytidylate kinase